MNKRNVELYARVLTYECIYNFINTNNRDWNYFTSSHTINIV